MRVVGQDGVPFYRTGIQPDVPMERSLYGVESGRDELLDKALEIIRER
jgi:C-terminal processing protease CtpA/Prc